MTRRIGPRCFLARPQTGAGVGNRVAGIQSLRVQVKQMDGPGITIAMRFGCQQIAVSREDIHAGEHGLRSLKEFIMQAGVDG